MSSDVFTDGPLSSRSDLLRELHTCWDYPLSPLRGPILLGPALWTCDTSTTYMPGDA